MGLIKALAGATGGILADQWKEFFYCDALDMDTLMVKGQKRVGKRSSNTKGSDNVISNGSGIAVADGQCMIIVEQGKVVEVCAEPGEYTYDASTEPSIFAGSFGDSLKKSFQAIGKRFTYGGDTAKDQRVYYFNTKEIMGNKFGTPSPILFEIMNKRMGFSFTVNVRCNGTYSYIISDPLVFYARIAGNVSNVFTRDIIDGQLKSEFVDALQPAFGALAEQELRPAQLPAKVFKDQNHIEEVKGLYVPVWLFDTDADAYVQYRATRTRTWSDSQYNYTATDYYAVLRGGGIGFENVPVDGSTKMEDALMESIEPFNIADAVPFQTAYLPGYMADKYDVDAQSSIDRANERIKKSTEDAFRSTVMGYTSVTTVNSNISLQNGKARYALYPVWILNTDWNGKKFTFAINGQTGKIAGDLPMDKGAFWKWLLGVSGAATAAAFAISYLMWLL